MIGSLPLTLGPRMLSQAHQAPATLVIFLLEHPKLVPHSGTVRWPSSLPSMFSHSIFTDQLLVLLASAPTLACSEGPTPSPSCLNLSPRFYFLHSAYHVYE